MRLGAVGEIQYVTQDTDVDPVLAEQACTLAPGVWHPPAGMMSYGMCEVDNGPTHPGYCNVVPFAASLFSECRLNTAEDLIKARAYTNFKIGQRAGLEREQELIHQDQTDVQEIISNAGSEGPGGCNYQASADHPAMMQIFGPSVTRMLTNPFSSDCANEPGQVPGWLLYVGIGVGAFFLIKALR